MMSKKKGVSAEEKRTRMLQLFYEKKDFFQLKELEKIAPKEKGIIAQSVKDVVQNLVDDGLVDTEKIGTSVYFWAYPGKAKHTREKRLSEVTEKYNESCHRLKLLKENLEKAKVGKEPSEERSELIGQVAELKKEEESLMADIRKYKDCDPEALEEMKNETAKAKEAANRWTDNIFSIKSWCTNKFGVEGNELDKQFGIPSELDYLD